ncbi:MAG: hypothetical protein GY854_20420 [Deltaproteobacteria bacterium]|nr:hypothetical protein [Deltaproteobacteria bacterium]
MTFTEAALTVLEREGRPMHSREIADKAVEKGILSHVGKTPVQTMSARLSAAVAKGKGKSPFIRIRPGVFALANWDGKYPGPAKEPVKEERAARSEKEEQAARPEKQEQAARPEKQERAARPKKEERTAHPEKEERTTRPTRDREAQDRSSRIEQPPKREEVKASEKHSSGQSEPSPAPVVAGQGKKKKRRRRKADEQSTPASVPPVRPKSEDFIGRVGAILRSQTRPLPVSKIAEQLGRGGKNGVTLVEALLVADGLDREAQGMRPRFIEHRGGFALAEREVSSDIITCERQVVEAKERLVRVAERQVLRRLRGLPMSSFIQVMAVHLQRSGFEAMVPVERDRQDEFHLSVQDRRHGGRFRTAVVIRRDKSEQALPARVVMDLRGALHHYDSTSGMIVTTGTVSEGARVEAIVQNLPPVALVDGEGLAREMVNLGIGVRSRTVSLPAFDDAFFGVLEG